MKNTQAIQYDSRTDEASTSPRAIAFAQALDSLCAEHGVELCVTISDRIGIANIGDDLDGDAVYVHCGVLEDLLELPS